MPKTKVQEPTRQFTAIALDAELGRRKNNRGRDVKVRPKSFVFPKLSSEDIDRIKAGEVVTVKFNSGRVEHVALKV